MEWLSCLQPSRRGRGFGRFTLVLETIIAQGNQRGSYPDHLTTGYGCQKEDVFFAIFQQGDQIRYTKVYM